MQLLAFKRPKVSSFTCSSPFGPQLPYCRDFTPPKIKRGHRLLDRAKSPPGLKKLKLFALFAKKVPFEQKSAKTRVVAAERSHLATFLKGGNAVATFAKMLLPHIPQDNEHGFSRLKTSQNLRNPSRERVFERSPSRAPFSKLVPWGTWSTKTCTFRAQVQIAPFWGQSPQNYCLPRKSFGHLVGMTRKNGSAALKKLRRTHFWPTRPKVWKP